MGAVRPRRRAGGPLQVRVLTGEGHLTLKADAVAAHQWADEPPATDSVVAVAAHQWADDAWLERRDATDWLHAPVSAYEVHLGSWLRRAEDGGRPLTYRELAEELPDYVAGLGFTHVSLMPVAEHPFSGSWGYQASSYFAPTARSGSPDDFRVLVDALHQRGLGVPVDWVPAHFPRDDWASPASTGRPCTSARIPARASSPDWGTLVFNFRAQRGAQLPGLQRLVRVKEFHADGLRVDGVASMLYLDYSRKDGEWFPTSRAGGTTSSGRLPQGDERGRLRRASGYHPGCKAGAPAS